jgi:hypothetical protein
MDGWLLGLAPLTLWLALALIRFTGCKFDSSGLGFGDGPELASYSDTILAEPDLVAYWRLAEATCEVATQATDEKSAHPGAYRALALPADDLLLSPAAPGLLECGQEGPFGGAAVRVDGGYVHVPFAAALNPAEFSVEAWVRPEWPASEMGVFHCVAASREDTGVGGTKRGFILYAGPVLDLPTSAEVVDSTLHWQAWVGDGTSWQAVVSTTPVVAEQATYLCATYDGTTLTLFAANESMDLDAPPATASVEYHENPGQPLYIGMGAPERDVPDPGPLYPFRGQIQDVAVYEAPLSGTTVVQHVRARFGV